MAAQLSRSFDGYDELFDAMVKHEEMINKIAKSIKVDLTEFYETRH